MMGGGLGVRTSGERRGPVPENSWGVPRHPGLVYVVPAHDFFDLMRRQTALAG
jgi:hypothetical protein